MVANAPTNFTLPERDMTVAIDVDDTPQNIAITYNDVADWCTETWASMIVRQGIPQNGQRNFFAGPWKPLININGSPAPHASPLSVIPTIPVAEGQRQWCAFRITRADGRLSEIFYANALCHSQAIGEVPNLIGIPQGAAEALLTSPEVQLTVGVVTTANHETIPVDFVISSDPIAHTRLNAGDPVDLVISLGPSA